MRAWRKIWTEKLQKKEEKKWIEAKRHAWMFGWRKWNLRECLLPYSIGIGSHMQIAECNFLNEINTYAIPLNWRQKKKKGERRNGCKLELTLCRCQWALWICRFVCCACKPNSNRTKERYVRLQLNMVKNVCVCLLWWCALIKPWTSPESIGQ